MVTNDRPAAISSKRPASRGGDGFDAQLRRVCFESTSALVATVEVRDAFTRHHSLRVARYSVRIARWMGLPSDAVEHIATAAKLHDIGKIGVPDAILNKPGPLDADEFEIIKLHPRSACRILGHATHLQHELPIILHHHERYDGTGYPDGLAGDRIPLGARILAVADSLDAMLSCRSYKRPMALSEAKRELVRCCGTQFDPQVVEAALNWLESDGPELTAHVQSESECGTQARNATNCSQCPYQFDNERSADRALGTPLRSRADTIYHCVGLNGR